MTRVGTVRPAYRFNVAFDEWMGRLIALGGVAAGAIGFVWGVAYDNTHWLKWELAGIGLMVVAAAMFLDALAIELFQTRTHTLIEPVQALFARLITLGAIFMGTVGLVWGVAYDNTHWLKWELGGIGLALMAVAIFVDALITARREATKQ